MSNDDDLIRKMIDAWFASGNLISTEDTTARMARVLAVVRAHDAGPARRVPVQITTYRRGLVALSNHGTLHLGEDIDGRFAWHETLPPLHQPGGGA